MRLRFRGERYELPGNSVRDSALAQIAQHRAAIMADLEFLIQQAENARTPAASDGILSLAELNRLHAEFYGGKK